MTASQRTASFFALFAAFSVYPAMCLCQSPSITTAATNAVSPVAYVYVGMPKGVALFYAAPDGKLTWAGGSPFKTVGLLVGSNRHYVFTLGTDYIHTYPLGDRGAIRPQVSQINTESYSGNECGTTAGAVLDHSGQDLYVLHDNARDEYGRGICAAYQVFRLASTSGEFTFLGSQIIDSLSPDGANLPVFTGDNKFAYAHNTFNEPSERIFLDSAAAFARDSIGNLTQIPLYYEGPGAPSGYPPDYTQYYLPLSFATGLTNQVAGALYWGFDVPYGSFQPVQLASFTVDTSGVLHSSNSSESMPYPDISATTMKMSPSGKLLAVGGWDGMEIFHFNGAGPITRYSNPLTTDGIDQFQWDNANHLYALSKTAKKLYVFTVTPTSITRAPGSPYLLDRPNAIVVVPM